jgi:hypothetical protein
MTYRCYSNKEYLSEDSKRIFKIVHSKYRRRVERCVDMTGKYIRTASAVEITQKSPISQQSLAFGNLLIETSLLKMSTIHLVSP